MIIASYGAVTIHFTGMTPEGDVANASGLVIEWQKTGFRSMEHAVCTTGFTNAGRAVGSPLVSFVSEGDQAGIVGTVPADEAPVRRIRLTIPED